MHFQSIIIQKDPADRQQLNWESIVPDQFMEITKHDHHPDLFLVSTEEGKHKLENLKELINWDQRKPYMSEYKMSVVEHAHKLNSVSQNKLLKMIEEPSPNTQHVLITDSVHSLLPTVVSRCILHIVSAEGVKTQHELAVKFLQTDSVSERLSLAKKISSHPESIEISVGILNQLGNSVATQSQSDLGYSELLDFHNALRRNSHNIRLTLETLTIMLVENK